MNNKLLLSTTALALASTGLVVASVPAAKAADAVRPVGYTQDPVSGYVEAFGALGQFAESEDGSTYDTTGFTAIGGAGRLNWWVSPTHTLQVDAYGQGENASGEDGETTFALAAHYGWRGMPTGNLALMGSVGQTGGERWTTVAVEGQLHGSNWTLYGQGGVVHPIDETGSVPYAAVQGRYFFNQNFEASADVTFSNVDGDSLSQFGAGLEFKPMGMPFSIFGRGQIGTINSGPYKETATEALFGVKLFVNQPSLWSNDVNGATYLDLNPVYGEFATKF